MKQPPEPSTTDSSYSVSRRSFLQTLGVSAAAGAATQHFDQGARADMSVAQDTINVLGPDPVPVTLRINGEPHALTIDPATTLMEALRWDLNLTGTKEVCDRGACGACSVLVDGKLIASCMMLALDAVGREVTTIEGLSNEQSGAALDPVQAAFMKHDALQCGFCTPGLVMASRALLNETPQPTLDQIKKGLSGNICRCGTYTNIFNAVLDASGQPPLKDREVGS